MINNNPKYSKPKFWFTNYSKPKFWYKNKSSIILYPNQRFTKWQHSTIGTILWMLFRNYYIDSKHIKTQIWYFQFIQICYLYFLSNICYVFLISNIFISKARMKLTKTKQMSSNTLRLNFCYLKIIYILHPRYHPKK